MSLDDVVYARKRAKKEFEKGHSPTYILRRLLDKYDYAGDTLLCSAVIHGALASDRELTRNQMNYLFRMDELHISDDEEIVRKFKSQNRAKITDQEEK